MIIDNVENLKEWLTTSLLPICEADPGALAKYVVALVKKEKPLAELKESCVDQLDVFLQTKTKPFVEELFQVLDNKSYLKEEPKPAPAPETEAPPSPVPEPDPAPVPVPTPVLDQEISDPTLTSSDQQLVSSTSKPELKKNEENKESSPIGERRRRSLSPRYRPREDDRRRRFEDRRPYDRGYPRRRSPSPRYRVGGRPRSRSPYRRRSPFRPLQRSRSPRPRGRGFGRSRSRSWSRSWSRSPRRSWSRSRSRERQRSKSPLGRIISRSKSPRRDIRPRSPRGRSPLRRSISPRFRSRSRSPRKRSRSPGRSLSRSPRPRSIGRSRSRTRSRSPRSPGRSRSTSPIRKVRRQSPDSRGPTPTDENGLVDSTDPTPSSSLSSISVVTQGTARFDDGPSNRRPRCRDFDEKGFCVRGDLCLFDHGADPVVVGNILPYPPGPPPVAGMPPGMPAPHMNMALPPPGFMGNRMPGPPPPIGMRPPRPDFPQEPYNPEAPAITRPGMLPYWPGGPEGGPPFMKRPPSPVSSANHVPVKSRLGNRGDLINLTVKKEVKDEPEDHSPTSSTRTVIAPKDEPVALPSKQPPPPGVPEGSPQQQPAPGPQKPHNPHQQDRFHPYQQRFPGGKRHFDYNRIGGYRRPDLSNCTLEVRKVPAELNNITKLNEHFSKFGTLVNLQVKFEGDPEGALITYSSNQEALSCYRCSEPVFNNRFIKLFWHQKNKEEGGNNQEQAPTSTTTPAPGHGTVDDPAGPAFKSRLGPIPPASKMQLNNLTKRTSESTAGNEVSQATTQAERSVVYSSSMGTISKTVYNPAKVAAVAAAAALKAKQQASLSSPTAVKAADFVTRMEKVKQHEEMKKEAAQKKLEIHKQKQLLLEKQIEQQKKLISTLEKGKDMKEATKTAIKETLKTLTSSIDKLKAELGSQGVILGVDPTSKGLKSPEQAKKEILDVELELITKTQSGEDTIQLKKKLAELTQVANSMGLLGRGRGRGAVARGRGATTWVASGIAQPPVVGRGRGRGALTSKAAVASRTLDRRPKILEVTGFDAEEKDEITSHINSLKDVEKLEFDMNIPSAIVTFKTRKDAEMGILAGSKFKTKTLKMQWHIPKLQFQRSISATSVESEDHEEIDEEALLAGVEDEEDEQAAEDNRSWRR